MCTGKPENRPGDVKDVIVNIPDDYGSKRERVKEPCKLFFQILFLIFAFIPLILWYKITSICTTKKKSVQGKVVLVSIHEMCRLQPVNSDGNN